MIINVKSFMAAVMAVVLILAVVVPITSAMVGVGGERVYSDNILTEDEYRMTRSTAAAAPRIAATDMTYGTNSTLAVGDQEIEVSSKTLVIGDTFVLEFFTSNTGYLRFSGTDAGDTFIFTSHDTEYVTLEDGTWTIYTVDSNSKTAGDYEYSLSDFADPESKAALLDRVPAANKELFTDAELEQMVKEGVDILRALQVYKTGSYSWLIYPDDTGTLYHADSSAGQVYVDSGSTIYCAEIHPGNGGIFSLQGTLSSMSVLYGYSDIHDIEANVTETAYSNLLESITYINGSHEYDIDYYIVPLKYTSGMDSGMTGALVSLIPVVLIVGLIISVVSYWFLRRGEVDL